MKYLNFFDAAGTKLGAFAWGLENAAAMQLSGCSGGVTWISKPANSVNERTWTVHKNTTHLWMFLVSKIPFLMEPLSPRKFYLDCVTRIKLFQKLVKTAYFSQDS